MCCNYCFGFKGCKKARKTNPRCCPDCSEYEFCPFIVGKKNKEDIDLEFIERDSDEDIGMLGGDIF